MLERLLSAWAGWRQQGQQADSAKAFLVAELDFWNHETSRMVMVIKFDFAQSLVFIFFNHPKLNVK